MLATVFVLGVSLLSAWSTELYAMGQPVSPARAVELAYFYMDGCPACTQAQQVLDELTERYPQLQVVRYRLPSTGGRAVLDKLREVYALGDISIPVPTMFVGEVAVVGRVFYGLAEEPGTLLGPAWALGIEEAVQRAVDAEASYVLRYCDHELRFCIGYPLDWSYAPPHGGTVVLSGSEGPDASSISIAVQGFPPAALGDSDASIQDFIVRYKYGIVLVSSSLSIDSTEYPDGDGYLAEYVLPAGTYRQWRVAVAHAGALLSWAYTAPADLFELYYPLAEAMLVAWELYGVE